MIVYSCVKPASLQHFSQKTLVFKRANHFHKLISKRKSLSTCTTMDIASIGPELSGSLVSQMWFWDVLGTRPTPDFQHGIGTWYAPKNHPVHRPWLGVIINIFPVIGVYSISETSFGDGDYYWLYHMIRYYWIYYWVIYLYKYSLLITDTIINISIITNYYMIIVQIFIKS